MHGMLYGNGSIQLGMWRPQGDTQGNFQCYAGSAQFKE